MSRETTVVPLDGHGFRLHSGDYTLTFDAGQLWIARSGSTAGLAFINLGEDGFGALGHVHQRHVTLVNSRPTVTLTGEHDWVAFALTFDADSARPGLFHWRFVVTSEARSLARPALPELAFTGKPQVTLYAQQAPMAAGLVYLYEEALLDSTLFYFQDLTALNDYFAASHTSPMGDAFPTPLPDLPSGIVGYKDSRLGLTLSEEGLDALATEATIVVSDGYLALTPGRSADEPAMALRFLKDMATVYGRISRPETTLVNWQYLARRTLADLPDPRNWVEVAGRRFLRAYVNSNRGDSELITQLDVLTSLRDYSARYGTNALVSDLDGRLSATLPYFYSAEVQAMLNQPLSAHPVADSWYFITGLVDLARLSRGGDPMARRLLADSVEQAVEIAHRYDYGFPIFFDPVGITHPPQPSLHPPHEYDVAGAYAYLMLDLYEETSETRYLQEAQAAVEALRGHGFDLAYELHVTALAATACARLFRLTGERSYAELSLMPLASILRDCWLWECEYGYAAGYRTFFGLLPMTFATVITPKEQYEAWQNLTEYLRLCHGAVPAPVEMLVAEFCRHTLNTMRSALAPLMPPESVAVCPQVQRHVERTAPELYIPLEDVRDGWQQSGNIAQELYGAGMALTFAAHAYVPLRPELTVYSEYPLVEQDLRSFTLSGTPEYEVSVALLGEVGRVTDASGLDVPLEVTGDGLCFHGRGGATYLILTERT
ncbi:MAG: hypothetical protein SXV54_22150 [Chloroflexota bacterium]|nr:hypothetical protein [Chloroflexota bacterium]